MEVSEEERNWIQRYLVRGFDASRSVTRWDELHTTKREKAFVITLEFRRVVERQITACGPSCWAAIRSARSLLTKHFGYAWVVGMDDDPPVAAGGGGGVEEEDGRVVRIDLDEFILLVGRLEGSGLLTKRGREELLTFVRG